LDQGRYPIHLFDLEPVRRQQVSECGDGRLAREHAVLPRIAIGDRVALERDAFDAYLHQRVPVPNDPVSMMRWLGPTLRMWYSVHQYWVSA
jgi:hypothetical protein